MKTHKSFKSFWQTTGTLKKFNFFYILYSYICYRELVSWVNEMMTVIEATELAKDLSGAEALLQSHKERKVPHNGCISILHTLVYWKATWARI